MRKKLIEKLKVAATWQERVEIARDKMPGTEFDGFFGNALLALESKTFCSSLSRQLLNQVGEAVAILIRKGDSQCLHDMAFALNKWKRHKPKPDHELAALFGTSGAFPPRWWKTWGVDENGKMVPGYKPVPLEHQNNVSISSVLENWRKRDPKAGNKNEEAVRRRLQRYAKAFGVTLERKAGAKRKLRHV